MSHQDARKIRLIMKLRTSGIIDTNVLSAIERVPRDLFVPPSFHDRAYEDNALPIGLGQTISQPYVVAYMTQELRLTDRSRVLEIGTGSGYQAAVLAKVCRRVFTVERHKDLLVEAQSRFETLKLRNIDVRHGDGAKGWPEAAPFERIMVTAAAEELPEGLLQQLSEDGGEMIIPVGRQGAEQTVVRVTRNGEEYATESLLPVRFVPLVSEDEERQA